MLKKLVFISVLNVFALGNGLSNGLFAQGEKTLSDFELVTTSQSLFRELGYNVPSDALELKIVPEAGRVFYIYMSPSRNAVSQDTYAGFLVGGAISAAAEDSITLICVVLTVQYNTAERTLLVATSEAAQSLIAESLTWEEFMNSYVYTTSG